MKPSYQQISEGKGENILTIIGEFICEYSNKKARNVKTKKLLNTKNVPKDVGNKVCGGFFATLRLCEGLEFEIRLTSGNDAKERDYKIIKNDF